MPLQIVIINRLPRLRKTEVAASDGAFSNSKAAEEFQRSVDKVDKLHGSALVHIKINSANDGTKTAIAFCVQPITEPSSS